VENVFFVKKVDLSSMQGALCTVSVFFILHFTYLGATPLPMEPGEEAAISTDQSKRCTLLLLH